VTPSPYYRNIFGGLSSLRLSLNTCPFEEKRVVARRFYSGVRKRGTMIYHLTNLARRAQDFEPFRTNLFRLKSLELGYLPTTGEVEGDKGGERGK